MPTFDKPRYARNAFRTKAARLTDHLATAEGFVRLSEQANRLRCLQTLLDAVLPAHLLPGTRIANLKHGKVIIHADSGAVAVKLRQLAPRLAAGFCQQGQEVTGIEVKVQGRRRFSASSKPKNLKTIGEAPKRALTSLANGLEEGSPIRRALEKLLRNA